MSVETTVSKLDFVPYLKEIHKSELIRTSAMAPIDRGVYLLWHEETEVCLKVGMGVNLRNRLRQHFNSNVNTSVLARHLIADQSNKWSQVFNFRHQHERMRFISTECYFLTLPTPDMTNRELCLIESFLVGYYQPIYCGRVVM